jgi:PAS domain S-box-containing protein
MDSHTPEHPGEEPGDDLRTQLSVTLAQLRAAERREARAVARMVSLQQATTELAAALTADEVTGTLLRASQRGLGAAAGVVYGPFVSGRAALLGSHGATLGPERDSLRAEEPLPLAWAMTHGEPLWLESYERLIERFPVLAHVTTPAAKLQSVVALPLLHAGRVLGGFALSFHEPQHFDEVDRSWLSTLAAQCAIAAERVRLYAAEHEARSEAEMLVRLGEALSEARLDMTALAQRMTDEATKLVGASFGAFFRNLVDQEGESYLLYTLSGAPRAAFATLGLPRNTPIFAPTFAGEGVVRLADVTKDPRYGTMAPHHGMPKGHLPVVSYLAVPVVSRGGGVLGGLFFGHPEPDRFTEQHERLVKAFANSAATAIENAQLYHAQKTAEAKQREVVEKLTQSLAFSELVTGVLAHDLRNPLSAILSAAEAAAHHARQADMARVERALKRIRNSGERMARMVAQLLDLTRIRSGGGIQVERRPVDLLVLVSSAMEELEAAQPGVRFQLVQRGGTAGEWDSDRLAQVLSNLLGNAMQHGDADTPITVTIDGSAPELLTLSVHNAGHVPAELIPTLFRPLQDVKVASEGSSGLGLGLFISREIATAHGGSIELSSSAATGTEFVLRLPRTSAPAGREPVSSQPAPLAEVPAALSEPTWELGSASERAKKFQLLVESVEDYAIFMLDPKGRVATWNAGAERIKGYQAREIIGHHFSRFYDEADVNSGVCEMELEVAEREGRFEAEGWRYRKGGTRFWANVVITALRDESTKIVGFAKVTRDLTQRREFEQERVRRAEAEAAVKLRDEFLAIASHELRTPLTILQLQLEALQEFGSNFEPRFVRNLQRAKRSSEALSALIEAIFDASRISTGGLVLSREPLDLGQLVAGVVERVQPAVDAAGASVISSLAPAVQGEWDRSRLEQVVAHLLWNALTYAAGAPVRVGLRVDQGQAELQICDGGPGIPEAALSRIFERFERASSSRHYSGFGLGLYFVRQIVLGHGGQVSARNLPEGGACIEVRLPLGSANVEPAVEP